MAQRLDSAKTASLVREAIRMHGKGGASADDALGDLIESEGDREEFRGTIVRLVRGQKFRIEANKIPIHPKTTLRKIFHVVAMSALPGETESGQPESHEPKPPDPNETAGNQKQQRLTIAAEKAQKQKSARRRRRKKPVKPR